MINREILEANGYESKDLIIAEYFLRNNNFIYSANPVFLTEKGVKYSKNGILKYFKDQKRDDILRSPIVLTILFFIPVIISIFGTIISYDNSQKIENKTIDKNQINQYIDSAVQTRINKLNKMTIYKPIIDSLKHIE